EWALYEAVLSWLPPDQSYRRSDARTGGLVVTSRLLDRIDVRGRQLRSSQLGDTPLEWSCSRPFLRYTFAYRGEFGASDSVDADVTERGRGRAFLKSITKLVAGRDEIFRPRNHVPEAGCGLPSATGYEWEEKLTSRFDYDLEGDRGWGEKRPTQVDFGSKHPFPLVDSVRKRLFPGADARFG